MIGSAISADRKSTRLNSSHSQISYAVFCLKKKTKVLARDTHTPLHPDSDRSIDPGLASPDGLQQTPNASGVQDPHLNLMLDQAPTYLPCPSPAHRARCRTRAANTPPRRTWGEAPGSVSPTPAGERRLQSGRPSRRRGSTRRGSAAHAGSFFFNDPPPTEIYTLSLHDALPI